jgi:hypothetical protein
VLLNFTVSSIFAFRTSNRIRDEKLDDEVRDDGEVGAVGERSGAGSDAVI